jgi:hypothetical protein
MPLHNNNNNNNNKKRNGSGSRLSSSNFEKRTRQWEAGLGPSSSSCFQCDIVASDFIFADENPKDLPHDTKCNNFDGVVRCPGTMQTQFIDPKGNTGIYNTIDTFTIETNANQFYTSWTWTLYHS